MALIVHIIIALSSVAYATFLLLRPSKAKFYINYGLIASTIASGTYLVVSAHARMLSSCITGLIYVGAVGTGSLVARRKLARQEVVSRLN